MKIWVMVCLASALVCAQEKADPYVGTFQGDQITLNLSGAKGSYSGTVTYLGRTFPVTVRTILRITTGAFQMDGQNILFTLSPTSTGLQVLAGGTAYKLDRKAGGGENPPVGTSRVAPEQAGGNGVRPEMVGKWCWVSIVNAQQGARTSNQCFVLNPDGSYQYSGETDSYNPYGGATTQQADAGTWTATETALTAVSRYRGTTVYQLEKRNHPKTGDPMLVLNGQPFVTYFKHARW